MLELIFRGFLEWVYVLLVEMWEFIADGLLDIMGLDFAYLQTHVPIIGQMEQILMAAGWALLLGNLVFQAMKSMAAGLGFEGEDPRLLFSRTFVFAFLLLASPQICRIGLDLTSSIMELLSVPDAADVKLVDESVFGALSAAWIMAIICSVIVMFKVLGLVIEIAERYVILAMLAITAPLAFAMGGSKNTASIFSGWCRMFGSMCLLMVTNLVCFKMLFSVLSTVPSGLDVLPWMVLIFAIVKVAKKSDAIITRIGLNPAITGGPGKSLPGMLAYTIVRTAASQVVKGGSSGGSGGGRAASTKPPSPGAGKSASFFNRFGGSSMGGGRYSSSSSSRSGGGYTYQSSNQQNASSQNTSQQASSQQSQQGGTSHTAQQNNARQENTSHASAQQSTGGGSTFHSSSRTNTGGGQSQQTRRSSVPPGTRRSPSHVPPPQGTAKTAPANGVRPNPAGTAAAPRPGASGTSTPRPGTAGTKSRGATPKMPNAAHPGPAGTTPKTTAPKQPNAAQPGAAGTGASRQSARSTHSASHTAGGSTVNNTSQTSAQTNVTMGGKASAPKAPAGSPRAPHPSGPAVPKAGGKPGKTRTTRREDSSAVSKTPGAPTAPGAAQHDPAGKPSRSSQRPSEAAPRPGRNTSPSTAAPPAGGAPASPAPQERTVSQNRVKNNGTAPGTVRQEQRKPASPAPPPVKESTPAARPGPAGTAPAGKQAASTKRPAERTKPTQSPPKRNKGGTHHG